MKTNKNEFWAFMITMIVGGLVYSIISFSYMTSNFPSKNRVNRLEKNTNRLEDDIRIQLRDINNKLDKLILQGR